MKMIVGLGNPGREYERNRHNAGFVMIERLAAKLWSDAALRWKHETKNQADILKENDLLLVKPQTFMNRSGEAVRLLADFYRIPLTGLWLVHDDLDLRLGEFKIQRRVGPKVHNGINSVENSMASDDFWRVRIGIDNRSLENREAGDKYVLKDFSLDEIKILETVIDKAIEELRIKLNET